MNLSLPLSYPSFLSPAGQIFEGCIPRIANHERCARAVIMPHPAEELKISSMIMIVQDYRNIYLINNLNRESVVEGGVTSRQDGGVHT
jgi:hypothetical protein